MKYRIDLEDLFYFRTSSEDFYFRKKKRGRERK